MADRQSDKRVMKWHPVDSEQMEVSAISADGASADRQFYSCVGSAKECPA